MDHRKRYLRDLRSIIRRYRLGRQFDWRPVRDLSFSLLFGLPRQESLSIGMLAVHRYLGVFRARWPDADDVVRRVNLVEGRVLSGETARPVASPLPALSTARDCPDSAFVSALRVLEEAVDAPDMPAERLAAKTEWVIWGCLYQRVLNVWAVDDPAAAAMEQEIERLMGGLVGAELLQRRRIEARLVAVGEFLQSRMDGDNPAANAVQWREWAIVADWLREPARRHPEVDEAGLRSAIERWGGSDDAFDPKPDVEGEAG